MEFLNTVSSCKFTPIIKMSYDNHGDPKEPIVVKEVQIDPEKLYDIFYVDDNGVPYELTGRFRSIIIRPDKFSGAHVLLGTDDSTTMMNVVETLIFDYSEDNHAHVKPIDVSGIRKLVEHTV